MERVYRWQVEEKGVFSLYLGEQLILCASARAREASLGVVDTQRASLAGRQERDGELTLTYESDAGLTLTQRLAAGPDGAWAQCVLSRRDGEAAVTDSLTPLVARGRDGAAPYLWRDLGAKMLLVPYDNDMWMRYEAVALRAGRRSFDVTVLYKEDSREGLLIGAADFGRWKNAVACPALDARILEARCGRDACGEDSHDVCPHGAVEGKAVASSRFMILYGADYRDLLERYADALAAERAPRAWAGGVPFGFNTYAGLALTLNEKNFRESADFLHGALTPLGFHSGGKTYVNLDGGWQRIPEAAMLAAKDDLHARGQLAGIYDAPFACFMPDLDTPLPLMPEHTFAEIVLRDARGEVLPRVDRAVPYDVTHPVWLEWTQRKARRFIDWGFDYLKIDFLSHGGMEGAHCDPAVRTGREALTLGYRALEACYDEAKMGRPFFLSLSIAPLFPYGYGTARRFSCDAFGLAEDVEYVLNAQTYAWWTGGRLYAFNDADHIVLQRGFCMPEDSTEGEARARYTSAVIAGSMMLLSEDYARPGARERTLRVAGNAAVNALARKGVVFRPVCSAGGSASHAYTARVDGAPYAALFSWQKRAERVQVDLAYAALPEGVYEDLWTGRRVRAAEGRLAWDFDGADAALLRLTREE